MVIARECRPKLFITIKIFIKYNFNFISWLSLIFIILAMSYGAYYQTDILKDCLNANNDQKLNYLS